jgi:hypothetical protein
MKFVTHILLNAQRSTQPHLPKTSSRSEELSHSFDSPDLIPANFLLFHKRENPKRCQDVKDIKKNVKTELDTVSLSTYGGCFVQLLEIHIVKEDVSHEKIKQFSSYFTCVSALVNLIPSFELTQALSLFLTNTCPCEQIHTHTYSYTLWVPYIHHKKRVHVSHTNHKRVDILVNKKIYK